MTQVNVANSVEIDEMLEGAVKEAIAAEFERVAQNMADPNTVAVQARKITIQIVMKPNINSRLMLGFITVKSSCNAHNPPMKATLLMSAAPGRDGVLHVALAEHQTRQQNLFEAAEVTA